MPKLLSVEIPKDEKQLWFMKKSQLIKLIKAQRKEIEELKKAAG